MKFALILLGSLLAMACSKDVSNGDGNTNITTNPNPPTNGTTPTNNAPTQYDLTIYFSNHGEIGTSDNLYTQYVVQENLLLTIPTSINTISYTSAPSHPNLILTLNNSYLCYFYWNNSQYISHSSCSLAGYLTYADVLSLEGVPQGQTVTIKFKYQK